MSTHKDAGFSVLIRYSNVVDIFTTLPPTLEDGRKDRSQLLSRSLIHTVARIRSASPPPQMAEETDPKIQSMEMAYKTVRRGHVGQISSALNKDDGGWKAAKAVMG